MTKASELHPSFRHIKLLLAREGGHPSGDTKAGYDVVAPLDADHRLDPIAWKSHQQHCRIRHFRSGAEDRIGRLRRKPGGQWYVNYDAGHRDDELGFRLGEERFVTGEYVSLGRVGAMHTYQVARVEKP